MQLISTDQLLDHRELSSLSNASVFGALQENSILWLLQNGRIYSLKKGECLFDQGQPGNSFHVILDGQVSYYKYHDGRYSYVKDYHAGEEIGFVSMIALHNRVGRAEAREDTQTLEIDTDVFHKFHHQSTLDFGILMMNLAREMARTIRSVGNLIVEKDTGTNST